ncbi:MAG: hypothetical protein ACFB50_19400 [Rubrobacteraceae bacterium]
MTPSGASTAQTAARVATLVSIFTRQPILAVPVFLAVGYAAGAPDPTPTLAWATACLLATTVLPLIYLLYLRRSGSVRDDANIQRTERTGPLLVVSAFWFVVFVFFALLGLPEFLRATFLAYLLVPPAFSLLTRYTNPSLHAAGAAWAAVVFVNAFGVWGLFAAVLLPLTWWSRLALQRHTRKELLIGTVVSAVFTQAAFILGA